MSAISTFSPTIVVKILWSESNVVNSKKFDPETYYPLEVVNKALREGANSVKSDGLGGYDKTKFELLVFDGTDMDFDTYEGRIDLGIEQDGFGASIVQNHIISYMEWLLNNKNTPHCPDEKEVRKWRDLMSAMT